MLAQEVSSHTQSTCQSGCTPLKLAGDISACRPGIPMLRGLGFYSDIFQCYTAKEQNVNLLSLQTSSCLCNSLISFSLHLWPVCSWFLSFIILWLPSPPSSLWDATSLVFSTTCDWRSLGLEQASRQRNERMRRRETNGRLNPSWATDGSKWKVTGRHILRCFLCD